MPPSPTPDPRSQPFEPPSPRLDRTGPQPPSPRLGTGSLRRTDDGARAAHRPRGAPPDDLPRRQAVPAGGGQLPIPLHRPHSAPPAPLGPTSPRRAPMRGTIAGTPQTLRGSRR